MKQQDLKDIKRGLLSIMQMVSDKYHAPDEDAEIVFRDLSNAVANIVNRIEKKWRKE